MGAVYLTIQAFYRRGHLQEGGEKPVQMTLLWGLEKQIIFMNAKY